MASDQQIVLRLRAMLKDVDLDTTTERMLREKLEEEFGADLADKKALIKEEVKQYIEEHMGGRGAGDIDDDEEDEPEDEDDAEYEEDDVDEEDYIRAGSKRAQDSGSGAVLSPEMQEFLGVESMGRKEVMKSIWNYINENNLKDPSDKRNIILDSKLAKLFTSPLTMVTINKQLTKHVAKSGGSESQASKKSRGAYGVTAGGNGRQSDPKGSAKGRKKGGRGGGKGFAKPLKVSAELADFLGSPEISRQELTKFMWAYFKENDLQNPDNRSEIISDDKLRSLMNVDRFRGFGFMKFLKHHIEEG